MLITRKNPVDREIYTKNINISQAQYDCWMYGANVKDCLSNLSEEDRLFITSGLIMQKEENHFS